MGAKLRSIIASVLLSANVCESARPEVVLSGQSKAMNINGSHISSMVAGLARVRKGSGFLQVSRERPHLPASERKGIFCYTLTRTPPEATVKLWEAQAAKACDGWAAFAHESNSAFEIIGAYTAAEETHGWAHQQQDMTLRGAWRHLAETGELWKYAWIVKTDADSFIRPSTLRRNLLRYDHARASTVSVADLSDRGATAVEGFFVAVSGALVDRLYPLARPDGRCNPRAMYEFASGHNNDPPPGDGDGEDCLSLVGFDYERDHRAFKDANNQLMVAQNQDAGSEDPGAKKDGGCEDIADTVMDHFRSTSEPLCGCRPGGSHVRQCISESFAIVHPVKEASRYVRLIEAFP